MNLKNLSASASLRRDGQPTTYNLQASRAFTLVEAIIYIAIVSVTLTAIIGFALNISNIKTKAVVMSEVQYNASFLEDSLKRLVSESGGLDLANSVFDSENGVLAILPADGLGASRRIIVNSSTKQLQIDSDFLSTSRVLVERFYLTKVSDTIVEVGLTLTFKAPMNSGPYFQARSSRYLSVEFKK